MNDILGGFFIFLVIAIVAALVAARMKIIKIPSFLLPPDPKCDKGSRMGVSYKPSSNVAPVAIVSKMNEFFDDMKPMLCKNDERSFDKQLAEYKNKTCTQVKDEFNTNIDQMGGFLQMSGSVTSKLKNLNDTLVDSICGSDNKIDETKATILSSDIKGMFC